MDSSADAETVAPICANMLRSGTNIQPPLASAASTRFCLRMSGLA